MKFIHSRAHGVIDYLFDFVLLIAPSVFGLSSTAASICYTVAAVHFVTSLCTKYEFSLFKVIPFPVHGMLELAAAIGLIAMPWMAGISDIVADRNFFIFAGVALFGVWATTNYGALPSVGVLGKTTSDDYPFRKAG